MSLLDEMLEGAARLREATAQRAEAEAHLRRLLEEGRPVDDPEVTFGRVNFHEADVILIHEALRRQQVIIGLLMSRVMPDELALAERALRTERPKQ